jgi:hypothetical protein
MNIPVMKDMHDMCVDLYLHIVGLLYENPPSRVRSTPNDVKGQSSRSVQPAPVAVVCLAVLFPAFAIPVLKSLELFSSCKD